MERPDAALLHHEPAEDGLGTGDRLYTSRDSCYETREPKRSFFGNNMDWHVRIYRETEDWHVKLRLPTEDDEQAYEYFSDAAETIEDAYDIEIDTSSYDFQDGRTLERFSTEAMHGTLRFNDERYKEYSLEDHDEDITRFIGASLASYVGTGAGIGAVSPATPTPIDGAITGGLMGGAAWGLDGMTADDHPLPTPLKAMAVAAEKAGDIRGYRKHRTGQLLDEPSFLDELNRKRRLEAEKDGIEDYETAEELRELEDTGVEELFDLTLRFQFRDFEQREGVTVEATLPTYNEARQFAGVLTGDATDKLAEPSIYSDKDVFTALYELSPERDRRTLVDNALDIASDEVQQYIDRELDHQIDRATEAMMLQDEPVAQQDLSRWRHLPADEAVPLLVDELDVDRTTAEQIYETL